MTRTARRPKLCRFVCATLLATSIPAGAAQATDAAPANAASRALEALPAAMIGAWGWSGKHCGPDDDLRVTVSARSVEFFAASFDLQRIAEQSDGTIRATAIVHEEGYTETTEGDIQLKLVATDYLSIKTEGSGLDHVYDRCIEHR